MKCLLSSVVNITVDISIICAKLNLGNKLE